MRIIKIFFAILIFTFLTLIPGCISDEEGPILIKVVVTPGEASVELNKTIIFTAVGWDQNNNQMAITPTWTVSGEIGQIAKKDGQVIFTGSKVGSGKITATVGKHSGSASISVKPITPVLTHIEISPIQNVSLYEGETIEFTAIGRDQFGKVMDITPHWSATNSIGTFAPNNSTSTLFTAEKAGMGEIIATIGQVTASVEVTVLEKRILATIYLQPNFAQLMIGQTQIFVALGKDQHGDPMTIEPTWSLTNNSIGTVTLSAPNSILFEATNIGTSVIVATVGDISGSATITVSKYQVLKRIEIIPASVTLRPSEKQTFKAVGIDENDEVMPINPSWSLTGSVGSIDSDEGSQAIFTASKVGVADIIATVDNISGSASITVTNQTAPKIGSK